MNNSCELSNVAKDYLDRYNQILAEMIQGMTQVQLSDSISHNFIVQMIPHHRAAIEMSQNILRYTTNIPLQNIALQIITEQTKSIENMQEIVCSCEAFQNSREDLCRYQDAFEKITDIMFSQMQSASATNQINADFLREMIPHHQGAIRMSNSALQYDICPCLIPILNAIISSQQRGVMQMRQLLRFIKC